MTFIEDAFLPETERDDYRQRVHQLDKGVRKLIKDLTRERRVTNGYGHIDVFTGYRPEDGSGFIVEKNVGYTSHEDDAELRMYELTLRTDDPEETQLFDLERHLSPTVGNRERLVNFDRILQELLDD